MRIRLDYIINSFIFVCSIYLNEKANTLNSSSGGAMVSVVGIHGFWLLESAVAQNASMSSNMTTGTNMSAGNATMSNTTGTSEETSLREELKPYKVEIRKES